MRRPSRFVSILAAVPLGLFAVSRTGSTGAQDTTPAAKGRGFVGAWRVVTTFPQGPPVPALGTLGADGTMMASRFPVVPSPNAPGGVMFLSAGHGAWEATGSDTAIVTFVAQTADGQGNPFATVTVRGRITLGPDEQTFSGANTVTMADPAGNTITTMQGKVEARRIVAEAPAA